MKIFHTDLNKTNILIFHKHHIKEFTQHQAYNISLHLGYIASDFQKNHYFDSTSDRGQPNPAVVIKSLAY